VSFYQDRVVPWILHLSMGQSVLVPYRRRVTSEAKGRVLEVGFGSGLNLPFYGSDTRQVVGLEPSTTLLSIARKSNASASTPADLLDGSAEAIPLGDHSVDTVVSTWTLCSIPDVTRALEEIRRVLRPEGRLLFVEHGRSPDAAVRRWQDRLNPIWKPLAGGCNLNRPISELIERSGFQIERVDTGYGRGPKPLAFMYEGAARPR
jgi:ubiquinone/menaquinone biosynthesis C-methylase UbiE